MSRRASLLLAVLVGLCGSAGAQQHPNTARGFGSSGSFSGGDLDSVNLFNGNLVIRLPIGPAYPVNGKLSYQLSLIYNNNVWDYQQYDTGTSVLTQALPDDAPRTPGSAGRSRSAGSIRRRRRTSIPPEPST